MSTALPLTAPTGCRLVSEDGQILPLLSAELSADARGGLARVVLRQRFANPTRDPMRVTLHVPLPADAAVSGFTFTVAGERIQGRVMPRSQAREQFEEALLHGHSAALLEEERSSLFSQEVGNVPGGAEVICEVVLDQPLAWQGAGWTWRFPTVVAPRFLGEAGRVADAHAVRVDVADRPTAPRLDLRLVVRDVRTGSITSPSHPVRAVDGEVILGEEQGVALDRDVVVRWPVAAPTLGATLDLARGATGATAAHTSALLTLVPPAQPPAAVPRDLIVLLDTSGSMHGAPLRQAQAVTTALIRTLGPQDQLQVIEFSNAVRSWKKRPVAMTDAARKAAITWVGALRAGGGTQMRDGILAALERVRDEAVRQVVLVTDGLIGFESEIVGAIARELPRGCRVHTVGIGSAVNRSLLQPAARAGGGLEVILGLDEDATEAAEALVAATAQPVVVDLELGGSALVDASPTRLPHLLAGRPTRLALRLDPAGGELLLSGRTADGTWEQRLTVPAVAPDSGSGAVVTLQARERVQDLEVRAACGESVDSDIEALGVDWQISTRLTSWLAVSTARTVDPSDPTRRVQLSQHLPHGLSAEGLGLRPTAPPRMAPMAMAPPQPMVSRSAVGSTRSRRKKESVIDSLKSFASEVFSNADAPAGAPPPAAQDLDDEAAPFEAAELEEASSPLPAPPAAPVREVHSARLRVHRGLATVEIYVVTAIRCIRPTHVRVEYDDGQIIEVETERSLCTGDGVWEDRDQVLRAVFRAPTRPGRIVRVSFDQPDDRILVMEL